MARYYTKVIMDVTTDDMVVPVPSTSTTYAADVSDLWIHVAQAVVLQTMQSRLFVEELDLMHTVLMRWFDQFDKTVVSDVFVVDDASNVFIIKPDTLDPVSPSPSSSSSISAAFVADVGQARVMRQVLAGPAPASPKAHARRGRNDLHGQRTAQQRGRWRSRTAAGVG